MGCMTTVTILNDCFSDIERDPEGFVRMIREQMNRGMATHSGGVQVMRTGHADESRLFYTHGNLNMELSQWAEPTRELAKRCPDLVWAAIRDAESHIESLKHLLDNPPDQA